MDFEQRALDALEAWYDSLERTADGFPDRGPIAAALIILEHLKDNYNLDIRVHQTAKGAQIKRQGAKLGQEILARFDEERTFTREWGRTNRSSVIAAGDLLTGLGPVGLASLPEGERTKILNRLQGWLVVKVKEYFERNLIQLEYNPALTGHANVKNLLDSALRAGKSGAAAQHLVGAKLQLRYPDQPIENHSFTTADASTNRPGDFILGDTVFHVTMAPMQHLFEKCAANVAAGYSVYVLVPESRVAAALYFVDMRGLTDRVSIQSLEAFLSQNLDELSGFARASLQENLYRLLELYNQRVREVELDRSLQLEIPHNLMPPRSAGQ